MFEEFGITLLDNEDCETKINGVEVRIGGLSTRYDLDWLRRFSRKDGYKILMCHHPEYYRKTVENTDLDTFDLVVSGHYHGGQWRMWNRAVYVPRTGLFMKDAVGQFDRLIISAGVANTTRFPRHGNPCELVMMRYRNEMTVKKYAIITMDVEDWYHTYFPEMAVDRSQSLLDGLDVALDIMDQRT